MIYKIIKKNKKKEDCTNTGIADFNDEVGELEAVTDGAGCGSHVTWEPVDDTTIFDESRLSHLHCFLYYSFYSHFSLFTHFAFLKKKKKNLLLKEIEHFTFSRLNCRWERRQKGNRKVENRGGRATDLLDIGQCFRVLKAEAEPNLGLPCNELGLNTLFIRVIPWPTIKFAFRTTHKIIN